MSDVAIYALTDPDTDEVRYLGKTRQSLDLRVEQHTGTRERTKLKGPWIAELQARGQTPRVCLLEVVSGGAAEVKQRESYHIAEHIARGASLLNVQYVPGRRTRPARGLGLRHAFKTLARLPDDAGAEFERAAKEKGLDPAVLGRVWLLERLQEERERRGRLHERRQQDET